MLRVAQAPFTTVTPRTNSVPNRVALTECGRALAGVAEETLTRVREGLRTARSAPLTVGIIGQYGYRWVPATYQLQL